MNYVTRNGKIIINQTNQDKLLEKIYGCIFGRCALKVITAPVISKFIGNVLDRKPSCILIDSFIKSNNIDMKQYIPKKYKSYNDFFTRKIKPELRPIINDKNILISPSDGKVSAYKITNNGSFTIKNTRYTIDTLLKSKKLSKEFYQGYCVIIRLTVDDYHRYCNVDNGKIISTRKINGKLHTVNPIANDYFKIYKENSREYCIIQSENFGKIIQMEVGALMVGKINNKIKSGTVKKGTEKGKFEFGGSTIVLLVKSENVDIDNDLIINTYAGYETIVKMGEQIGVAADTTIRKTIV